MDTEFRILDILSREIGNALSISKITQKVRTVYRSGDYKNIHVAIKKMQKDKIVTLEQTGNTSIASINFENYLITDLLSVMELAKKQNFLKNRQEMQMIIQELDTYIYKQTLIQSISIINPERNTKLNKVEFLFHIKKSDKKTTYETKNGIYTILNHLQMIHNIRIDSLVLEDEEFFDQAKSNEANPVREMFYDKITISNPQNFWLGVRNEIIKGSKIKIEENQTHPAKIPEEDLVYNLARFGYSEFGPKVKEGRQICVEYVIAAMFFHKDARRNDSIPVILAKNTKKTSYDMLLFVSRKYEFAQRLLGILKSMGNLVANTKTVVEEPISLLEAMNIEEIKVDSKRIKERLRLYNVI